MELDNWLRNWAHWLADTGDCRPVGFTLASAEADYRCPQRWHHGTQPPRPDPVYPVQAELVERSIHAGTFPPRWRAALIATWVRWPEQRLLAARIPADLWPQKRAAAAALAVRTYLDASDHASARLAAVLTPWRGSLP